MNQVKDGMLLTYLFFCRPGSLTAQSNPNPEGWIVVIKLKKKGGPELEALSDLVNKKRLQYQTEQIRSLKHNCLVNQDISGRKRLH